ncbi:MAG: holo-ACP synthase [Acidobacteria bacterium]|nr:holo-ACP synthase [Acidobacteriota bacterium]
MVKGLGVDIVEIHRIADSIERMGERFLKRVFTAGEISYCESRKNKYQHYAARFAAKEAAFKALGRGWQGGLSWRDVEVHNEPSGQPQIFLHGAARELARQKGMTEFHLSLSHTDQLALAEVILS